MITKLKGFALGVVTADCVPILFDNNNKIIGCIHAGWKGAFKGVVKIQLKNFVKLIQIIKFLLAWGHVLAEKVMRLILNSIKTLLINQKKTLFIFQKRIKIKSYLI